MSDLSDRMAEIEGRLDVLEGRPHDSRLDHDIGWAVAQLRAGKRVRRPEWKIAGWYLRLVEQERTEHEITLYCDDKIVDMRPFDNSDLLATDWELLSS